MKKRIIAFLGAVCLLLTAALAAGDGASFSLEGRTGRVALSVLDGEAYSQLKKAVIEHDGEVDRWIVDLRGAAGGYLPDTAKMAGAFLGQGGMIHIVNEAGKVGTVKSEEDALTIDPVIVLVDSATSGAAELLAAAVRDGGAGLVVGSRTAGKGKTQDPATGETISVYSAGLNSNDIIGVLPHLMVKDELTERVAKLMGTRRPDGDSAGYAQIHLASWRWFVDLTAARADQEALTALLEALPPQCPVFLGQGGTKYRDSSVAELAAEYGGDYEARVFPDVDGSPYQDAINTLKTYGVLKGNTAGQFLPKGTLDRKTLCVLLAQAMGYPKAEGEPLFPDTPNTASAAWYTPYVTTLASMGIIKGGNDGLFHPDDPIPHEQFMIILSRIAGNTNLLAAKSLRAGADADSLATGDYNGYSSWARNEVWLLDGLWHAPAKDIAPQGTTTREEAAYDLWAMLNFLGILPG